MSRKHPPREQPLAAVVADETSKQPPLREWWRGFLLSQLVGTVFGPINRLIAAFVLGAGGVFLTIAWQVGPQKALDAAEYATFTKHVTGKIVESWLAVELDTASIRQPTNWRASAKASPCAVVEYETEWGTPTRRAYCGTRLGFSSAYTLHDLTELAPHVPFAWVRDASGFIVPEIRIDAHARDWLAFYPPDSFMHGKWPARSALDELRIDLDRPVDYAIAGWIAPAPAVPLAFDPRRPAEALPTGIIAARLDWQPGTLILAIVIGVLGLAVWWEGMTVLLGENMMLPGRVIIAVLPLLALPWWGEQFPRALRNLNVQFAEVIAAMLDDIGSADRFIASDAAVATLAGGQRLIWRAREGVYRETFGRIGFAMPIPAPSSADAALAALADTVTRQTSALRVDERSALFSRLNDDKLHDLRAVGLVFLPAAKQAVLDSVGDPRLRRAATKFLSEWLMQPVEEPHPRDLGYRERVRLFGDLADVPVPEISIMAGSWVERDAKKQ